MRCAVVSRAGQVLANGHLILHQSDDGKLRLDLQTDGGDSLKAEQLTQTEI